MSRQASPLSSEAIWTLLREYDSDNVGVVLEFARHGIDFPKMLHEFLQSEAGRNGNISSPSPSINAVSSNPPSTIPSPQLVAQIEGATRRISAQDPSRWKKTAQTDSVFLSSQGRTGTTSQQPGTSGSRGPLSQREANLMNQKEADDAFFAQFMLDK